jgi:hypothetical protein
LFINQLELSTALRPRILLHFQIMMNVK